MPRSRWNLAAWLALLMLVGTAASGGAAVPGRSFELASPPSKNGGDVLALTPRTRAAAVGGAVTFTSMSGFADVIGAGVATEYLSRRSTLGNPGDNGWNTHGITPRQESMTLGASLIGGEPTYQGSFAPDLSSGVFQAWSPLTNAPSVADAINLYVRHDLLTPGPGSYMLVSDCPLCLVPLLPTARSSASNRPNLAGGSADFSHVIFESGFNLARGATGGTANRKLYEAVDGAVRLVGVLPNGAAAARSVAGRGVSVQTVLRNTSHPISRDGSRILFTVPPNNTAESGTVYMRINGQTTVRLNASERAVPEAPQNATYWDASADAGRVFFTTAETLTDDAPTDGALKVYMWERQPSDETQSVTVSATGGTYTLEFGGQATEPIAIDASAAAVESALTALTTIGSGNVRVTGGPGDAAGSSPYAVAFTGDLSGVNVATMTTDASLLTGGAGTATVATINAITNLTHVNVDGAPPPDGDGNDALSVIGTSDDGRYVYFAARGQLVDGQDILGIEIGLYVWHEGEIAYIGQSSRYASGDNRELIDGFSMNIARRQARVTPDGRHLLFNASSGDGLLSAHGGVDYDHTAADADCGGTTLLGCRQLYVYSADTGDLACVSCNPSGAPGTANGDVSARGPIGGAQISSYVNRPITDDGRFVFFSTREALVPADVNNRIDAYQYDVVRRTPQLLSSGTDTASSYFMDASADGTDAFFTTRERLVGWDVDENYDLYDARIGGGFPEPVTPAPVCVGDVCQGGQSSAPGARGAASATTHSSGDARPGVRPKKRCRPGKVRKRVHGQVRCVRRQRSRNARRGARSVATRRTK